MNFLHHVLSLDVNGFCRFRGSRLAAFRAGNVEALDGKSVLNLCAKDGYEIMNLRMDPQKNKGKEYKKHKGTLSLLNKTF